MKLHKLISKAVIATALLGATIGGTFAGMNANAQDNDNNLNREAGDSFSQAGNGNGSSDTQADITQGFLTLDAVPNLNFGNNNDAVKSGGTSNTNLKLNNNNTGSSNDGNNAGSLRVTDYRSTNKVKYGAWTLNASLSNFTNISSSSVKDTTNSSPSNWTMHLNNDGTNYSANNYNRYTDDTNNTQDTSNNNQPHVYNNVSLGSTSNNQPIMSTNNNYNNGHGLTEMKYNSSSSLDVPYNVQPGKYSATINWNLTANPDSNSNETNGTPQTSNGRPQYNK